MGVTYTFRVEARNAYGYSEYSAEVSVLAAGPPSTPHAPATAVSGSDIVVTWPEPATNGAAITAYTIYVRQSNFQYTVVTDDCAEANMTSSRTCTID